MWWCKSWTIKKVQISMLSICDSEKTLENPLDSKDTKVLNPKGNKSWIFTGRTDDEAEVPILWATDGKSWLTGKDPDAGVNRGQEEKEGKADEIAWWHYDSVDMSLSKFWEIVKDRQACYTAVHGLKKSQAKLRNRTTFFFFSEFFFSSLNKIDYRFLFLFSIYFY